jgi:hypothetical protein
LLLLLASLLLLLLLLLLLQLLPARAIAAACGCGCVRQRCAGQPQWPFTPNSQVGHVSTGAGNARLATKSAPTAAAAKAATSFCKPPTAAFAARPQRAAQYATRPQSPLPLPPQRPLPLLLSLRLPLQLLPPLWLSRGVSSGLAAAVAAAAAGSTRDADERQRKALAKKGQSLQRQEQLLLHRRRAFSRSPSPKRDTGLRLFLFFGVLVGPERGFAAGKRGTSACPAASPRPGSPKTCGTWPAAAVPHL